MGRQGFVAGEKRWLDAFEGLKHLLGKGVEGEAADAAGELCIDTDLDQPGLQHTRRF